MEFALLPWITLIAVAWCGNASPAADQHTRHLDWLSRYGYLPPPDPRSNRLQTMEGIKKAVRDMQRFGGIRETGELDDDTLKLMSTPRCSLPDIIGGEEDMRKRRRRKRYALAGVQWDKKDLTWSVHRYPSPSLSASLRPELVDSLLTLAFKAWSDAAPLRFTRLQGDRGRSGGPGGDIRVSFIRSLHEDGYPFDGRGGTLAHAFFPGRDEVAGDTHFDDDEVWSYEGEGGGGTDLFTVAVHEFGHALGLSHSSTDPSIMRPYYQGPARNIPNYRLPLDDVLAIQQLYGVKDGRPTYPTGDPDPDPPLYDPSLLDRCEGGFDAVANVRGEVFFFKGVYFWRTQRDGSLVSNSPALIKNFWMGLPPDTNRVDAVYERKSDSCIIFFIGPQYWVFKDTQALEGYPRPLSDWGMRTKSGKQVDKVDAAFIWAHNGHTYLFSGGEYWRFDESHRSQRLTKQPESDYPRDVSRWKGVPSDLDDIISWGTGQGKGQGETHVFKDNYYLVLKGGEMGEDDVSPKSTAVDWLRCPAATAAVPPDNPKSKDCSCSITGSSSLVTGSWLLLLSALWASEEFIWSSGSQTLTF